MQAFLWYRPETAWRDLDLIKNADFGWVRQMFAWTDIEGAGKGTYDWSRTDRIVRDSTSRGINILASIFKPPAWLGSSYPSSGAANNWRDLADFLSALASRYRGCIRAYSIWNEPNLSREWGNQPNPTAYAQMLKVAFQAIKNADPGALVFSAGLSPTGTYDSTAMPDEIFLEQMYQAGAAPYFDALGLHAPGYKAPPETSPQEAASNPEYGGQRFFTFRHVEDMRAIMVQYGDEDKQVAILEFGWTSDPRPESPYYWHSVTQEEKADYLVRAFAWAKAHWSPWIGVMTVIYLADADWTENDEQYWWAITHPDGRPRRAYTALKEMPK
ncbi:MAG: cellulase family glycosylhydrolase [Chloroflexi bacterium]|nr:cellulase family glycosylhydrolase [Chloroflexota bacterium]